MSNLKVFHLHMVFRDLVARLHVHLSALDICLVEGRGPTTFFFLSTGMVLGIFVVLLVGGVIIQALGWPFVFYIFGKLLASELFINILLRLCVCVYFTEGRESKYKNVREAKYHNKRK